ncbi:MAG TPA: hypothetical protein VMW54_10295 [Terriglobia bacterium]|nr:hypothetical protein [Terriglobia bacterium]
MAILAGGALFLLIATVAYRLGMRHSKGLDAVRTTQSSPESGCLDLQSAGKHTGENNCVAARVLRVFTSRSGSTFLDFCADYRKCPFTSVIFASDRSQFGNLSALEGRKVEIRGEITSYNGRAEIIIHNPRQVRAVP